MYLRGIIKMLKAQVLIFFWLKKRGLQTLKVARIVLQALGI